MRLLLLAIIPGCVASDEPINEPVTNLPACASPHLEAIYAATRGVISRGNVDEKHYVTHDNRAEPTALVDGPQIFPAFRELIGSAKHEVALQTYVWEPGSDPANDILDGLLDLARRRAAQNNDEPPVIVRFLFDASTLGFGSKIEALPQTWASVQALQLDPRHVRFEIAGFDHFALGNLHVKTLVVDGREAIVTGANPQAHHNYAEPWRDAGFRFSGEVARSLLDDFDDAWSKGKLWTCGATEGSLGDCSIENTPIARGEELVLPAGGDACQPMLVVTRQADANPTSNRTDNTQDQAFLAAFATAGSHIRMQTPNLNDDAAKDALVAAVVRGVRVDIVLSKGFNDSSESAPGQGGTNAETIDRLYAALATAGIANACERMRFRWHARDGQAVVGNGVYASHAKYTSLDDAVVIVGTANMDTQSWNFSREVNVLVDDPAITRAWDEQVFLRNFDGGVQVEQCD